MRCKVLSYLRLPPIVVCSICFCHQFLILFTANFVSIDLSGSVVNDDEVLQFLGYCKRLRSISFANCQRITDKTLDNLLALVPNLAELNISNCQLITNYGVNLVLQKFPSMVALNASNLNCISPIFLPNLKNLYYSRLATKMVTLDLSHSNVRDSDVVAIYEYFENLRKICLVGCNTLEHLPAKILEKVN